MHDEVKKRVDNKDIRGLQYVFADCLDVDPTFEKYKEDFEYCRKMLPEMFETHRELMPFSNNQANWTDDYWDNLKMDLLENFSVERFGHMQDVAKVVYAEKIGKLVQEREAAHKKLEQRQEELETSHRVLEQGNQRFEDKVQTNQENQNYHNVNTNVSNNTHKDYTNQNMQVQQQIKSQKQKQEEELEAERRALAQKNQRFEENKAREEQRKEQLRRSENIQVSGGTETKKVMGAVLVIVVFLIIVIIVVMAMRN